jgi:uncharacterized surface protein with fasciclin (FAS1) repeats
VLSTLVAAVSKAGLVDSLNTRRASPYRRPTTPFTALGTRPSTPPWPARKGLLTKVLTYHVVAGTLTRRPRGFAQDLEGTTLMVAGSGTDFTVNGSAKVVCGNVPTANATVYLIDSVLLPKS